MDRLCQALLVSVVDVPGEPVHHALGRVQKSQDALGALAFSEVVDDFLADGDRACRKFDEVGSVWVAPLATLFHECER